MSMRNRMTVFTRGLPAPEPWAVQSRIVSAGNPWHGSPLLADGGS
jgi:hypothetical protein